MAKYRTDLVTGQPLPESFLDELQEYISTLSANLVITKATGTTIQIVGGTGNAQVALGISGLWRYNTATVTAAMPGSPSAGTYDIYAVASANSFSSTPAPDTDNTDYSFGLQIVTSGGSPSGSWNGNAITASRKIATLVYDGTQISAITQTVGTGSPITKAPARTLTNWSAATNAVRTIDRNAWTLGNLFDFVMTMADDLRTSGVFQ